MFAKGVLNIYSDIFLQNEYKIVSISEDFKLSRLLCSDLAGNVNNYIFKIHEPFLKPSAQLTPFVSNGLRR